MQKPVILAVDDEPGVLAAVARDLRREYGEQYRILRADSGPSALDALQQIKQKNESVALLIVDQRMPGMTGVELLAQAMPLFPEAKRALLTAYADTDAAIRAINEVHLDHYLMKPWDPPEERLYPVVTDLLDDWRASVPRPFDGIRIVDHRWSAKSHELKDFLARNQVPYLWLEAKIDPDAVKLSEVTGGAEPNLPLVVFPDGTHLERPTVDQVAERIGLRRRPGLPFYDLLIVGGGPAGLAAAVYGASEGLRTLLVEGEAPGGQAGMSSRIENYLGFPVGLSGSDLARRAVAQATRFGAEILTPFEARELRTADAYRILKLSDGSEVSGHTLLIATGVSYRRLEVPGVERLTGSGVYYGAATTEAVDARDKDVFVVGGGNSAGQAAMYLSRYARSVTILIRAKSLTASMSRYLIDQIEETPNVSCRPFSIVCEAHGDGHLEAISLSNVETGTVERLPAHAIFIFIGAAPHTDWVAESVERDAGGYILSGPDLTREGRKPRDWPLRRDPFWLETSVPGVFVAGDVRHRSIKRLASAVGEGSMAVQFVHQYLGSL